MRKDKAIETINKFPQEIDIEKLMEQLIFTEKVEKGLEQLKEGETISHEQVKRNIDLW